MRVQKCCFNVESGARKACWILTNNCNLACEHCASSSGMGGSRAHFGPDDHACSTALSGCLEIGVRRVVLTGGEPLLVPHLAGIVRRFKDSAIRVSLATNATLLGPQKLEELAVAGVSKFSVGVNVKLLRASRWSPRSSLNDRVVAALKGMRSRGIPFDLNLVLLPEVREHIEKIAAWCKEQRPASIHAIVPQRCGRLLLDYPMGWSGQDISKMAGDLSELVWPVEVVLVSPMCRDIDCPSKRLVFGVLSDGALYDCPWKVHLGLVANRRSFMDTGTPSTRCAVP